MNGLGSWVERRSSTDSGAQGGRRTSGSSGSMVILVACIDIDSYVTNILIRNRTFVGSIFLRLQAHNIELYSISENVLLGMKKRRW